MVPSSCCSSDARTSRATFSKLPETKWRERHFVCFDFVSQQRCSLQSQLYFCSALLSFVLYSIGCSLFGLLLRFRQRVQQLCKRIRYKSLFISLPLLAKGHQKQLNKRTRSLLIEHLPYSPKIRNKRPLALTGGFQVLTGVNDLPRGTNGYPADVLER